MHRHLLPAIERVVEHMDPESILSFNVNVSNLLPMVKMMEEQYRDNKRLERELRHYETEIARLQGGR
jgi:predicted ATP-grasp superfamily ATP-dependent carboligase